MTLGEAVREAAGRLAAAGIDNPRLEAALLLGLAAGIRRETLLGHPERPLGEAEAVRLGDLVARRAGGEPLAHITGEREFWSLPFLVSPDTLIPRPDSETLIEAALEDGTTGAVARLLDLGTGSGCLLLALLSELPRAWGLGLDVSPAALAVASENARRLGLDGRCAFVAADWATPLAGRFDLVVSNPPYVARADIAGLRPEVARHEPMRALDGGPDGLDAYRVLAASLPGLLRPGGRAVLEVGIGQAGPVADLLTAAGLRIRAVRADLGGIARCVVAELPTS